METVLVGHGIVVGSVALALLAHWAVRRTVPLEVLRQHHEVAGVLMAIVGGLYGVVLAFTVVAVWEEYELSRHGVAAEANGLADVYRLSQGLSPDASATMRREVRRYVEAAVAHEWPALARGEPSAELTGVLDAMWQASIHFEPSGDRERNLHLSLLGAMQRVGDERRVRVMRASLSLPVLLWAVIVVGGVITLGFSNFFGLRYRRSQALMTAALAATLSFVVFVIYVLDRPFRGASRIEPDDLEEVRRLVDDAGGG